MADPAWPETPQWRESWDHLLHGFNEFGELASIALCGHPASNTSLKVPSDSTRDCRGCLHVYVHSLADGGGDGISQ